MDSRSRCGCAGTTGPRSTTSGGSAAFSEKHDGTTQRIEVANRGGKLERRYFVDDKEQPFDAAAHAWMATLIGLFETGYISSAGFFDRDVRERNIRAPGMTQRIADCIRRGRVVCENYGIDLFDVDYYFPHPNVLATTDAALGILYCALPFLIFTRDYMTLVNLGVLLTFVPHPSEVVRPRYFQAVSRGPGPPAGSNGTERRGEFN